MTLAPELQNTHVILHHRGRREIFFEDAASTYTSPVSALSTLGDGQLIILELGIVKLNVVPLDGGFRITKAFWYNDEVHSVLLEISPAFDDDQLIRIWFSVVPVESTVTFLNLYDHAAVGSRCREGMAVNVNESSP